MATLEQALAKLNAHAHPEQLEGMSRFAILGENRLGLSVPEMRQMAKELKPDHGLALALWETGIPDAMMVASMIDDPHLLTDSQMEDWVGDFMSWDLCDQVCANLFDKSPLAWSKVLAWSGRPEEFVRRAAFALLACLAWHDKSAPNGKFVALFPAIVRGSTDERNFVKKAVSWALRTIGKRNLGLNVAAIQLASQIAQLDSKPARWIASDTLRELRSEPVQRRLAADGAMRVRA
jgi:3-methyladenine DNA glycosylase AlkD